MFLQLLLTTALAQDVQEGDLIFHTSLSSQSEAIQLATNSPFSHVGIVTIENGQPMVFEAIRRVSATPLEEWIRRGEGGRYRLMRLKTSLTEGQLSAMRTEGQEQRSKSYDLLFDWSDEKMYCSELVWKIYQEGAGIELAKPRPMEDYNLSSPRVRSVVEARWGSAIKWQEPMVAPSDLAESPLLETVFDSMN